MKGVGRSVTASDHVRAVVPTGAKKRAEQCRKNLLRCGWIEEKDVGKGEF
ncbi:MAG: hypothetical protein MI862_25710 [Desulfobacterales bacterium]|nr:hypothetical protein [Desulfobacterales bacterium]